MEELVLAFRAGICALGELMLKTSCDFELRQTLPVGKQVISVFTLFALWMIFKALGCTAFPIFLEAGSSAPCFQTPFECSKVIWLEKQCSLSRLGGASPNIGED